MPEYLAPGVYVEEIAIGARPIEGVSTSTAGFVGMTERGPLNRPTLVTSFAEYQRIFGGYLNEDLGDFRFLPYAIEGFFTNGGQRAYITRVASSDARRASGYIPSMPIGATTIASLSKEANSGDTELSINKSIDFQAGDIFLLEGGNYKEYLVASKDSVKSYKLDSEFSIKADRDDDTKAVGQDSSMKLTISNKLTQNFPIGAKISKLELAIRVIAASEGSWGENIKIVIKHSSISKARLALDAKANQNYLDLDSVVGMEKGTLISIDSVFVSVKEVIQTADLKRIILETNLPKDLNVSDEVSTAEFDLIIHYDGFDEIFKNLSMNKDHSRYFLKIINSMPSNLIKVEDISKDESPVSQRLPLPTKDNEPGWKLRDGIDGIPKAEVADAVFMGQPSDEQTKRTGLYTLENIEGISIVSIPGVASKALQSKLISHCELMGDRFAVLDATEGADLDKIQSQRNWYDSKYAALYYPWISIFDPLSGDQINAPSSGHVCGIYARSDNERGVHKAPANEVIRGALDLEDVGEGLRAIITKGQQDVLNPKGINCIRAFPGRGIRVWGARTISSDPLWRYVNVRRLFLFVEKSIEEGTQWVVFEPNDENLWARVKQTINQFLERVWKDGALMGTTQAEAFFVKCDRTTMTQQDIDAGKLIVLIGIAPVKPAEFVIFRIAQVAKGSSVSQ